MNRNRTHPGEKERMADRRSKALELRMTGMRYEAIGQELGVSMQTAHKDVKTAMDELAEYQQTQSIQLRNMELIRLDSALAKVHEVLGETGDPETKLKAVDRLIRISESRRKLLGLDQPQRIDVTTGGEPMQKRVVLVDNVADRGLETADDRYTEIEE